MSIFAGLSPPYATIVADPPWPYDDAPLGHQRDYGKRQFLPYSAMTLGQIAAMPVQDLSQPGGHLYLWTTNRFLFDARDIALGWGFIPVTTLVWCKQPMGLGGGSRFAITTEFVLFACRENERREVERAGSLVRQARESAGLTRRQLHEATRGGRPTGIVYRWEADDCLPTAEDWDALQAVLPALRDVVRPTVPPPPDDERKQQNRVDTTWWQWKRAGHSAKPPAFGDIVEQVSPGPYVELFARAPRLGWDSWGYGHELAPVGGPPGTAVRVDKDEP